MASSRSRWLIGRNFCSRHMQVSVLTGRRLGIELAKIMVLQYSNNESSISIGESVRDEDGTTTSRCATTYHAYHV